MVVQQASKADRNSAKTICGTYLHAGWTGERDDTKQHVVWKCGECGCGGTGEVTVWDWKGWEERTVGWEGEKGL